MKNFIVGLSLLTAMVLFAPAPETSSNDEFNLYSPTIAGTYAPGTGEDSRYANSIFACLAKYYHLTCVKVTVAAPRKLDASIDNEELNMVRNMAHRPTLNDVLSQELTYWQNLTEPGKKFKRYFFDKS